MYFRTGLEMEGLGELEGREGPSRRADGGGQARGVRGVGGFGGLALISYTQSQVFHGPVRESEQAEGHRFPGDPVHPIPAQQGDASTSRHHRMGAASRSEKQNTWAPGLTGCGAHQRPVSGAPVQFPTHAQCFGP